MQITYYNVNLLGLKQLDGFGARRTLEHAIISVQRPHQTVTHSRIVVNYQDSFSGSRSSVPVELSFVVHGIR
jgi:hypothetical protein